MTKSTNFFLDEMHYYENQVRLGASYYYGTGVEMDCDRAAEIWEAAQQRMYHKLERFRGKKAEEYEKYVVNHWFMVFWRLLDKKYREVQPYWKLAVQGDVQAQYLLGECHYLDGTELSIWTISPEICFTSAVRWFGKAAAQGHDGAQRYLGDCCNNGEGVAEDKTAAADWYEKSAAQGNLEALYRLGWCYEKGEGRERDEERALQLWKQAAVGHFQQAERTLEEYAEMLARKKAGQTDDDKGLAGDCLPGAMYFSENYSDYRKPEDIISIMPPRPNGKAICARLRQLRRDFAEANGIPFSVTDCYKEEACAGTCWKCDEELKYLNREIKKRQQVVYPAAVIEERPL